ncbi:glycosyltransferase [Marinicrinis lubricantis]|uniref:Glycosyltransferase n=1 Tax=Marinicrinis lubricantis TaxID=2086470 RepID=A0ABW1IL40_9BACL
MEKSKYKIIHVPLEIAGQVGMICDFTKKAGHHAAGYNYFPNTLKYNRIYEVSGVEQVKILEPATKVFDLFHFHNGYTILPGFKDVEMIRDAGKKMIMHHRGNDVRSRKRSARWNGYDNPYVYAEGSHPDADIDRNLRFFAKHMDAAIVQDFELYHYVIDYYAAEGKSVYMLPRLIDPAKTIPSYPSVHNKRPLIVHAPTNRLFKGSDIVIKVVEQLKKEIPLDFKLIEGMSHAEALRLYQEADIIIDQILCGAYGNLSVEGMALGKAVICYVRPDIVATLPSNFPVVSANPDTLYDRLKELALDSERRHTLGRMGRTFIEQYHDGDKIIPKLLAIYGHILQK